MEHTIKRIRVKLDGLAELTNQLELSAEVVLAKRSFQLSKMMLGKVLAILGAKNPYPESKNPANDTIEKTADTADLAVFAEGMSNIAKIKEVRRLTEEVVKEIANIFDDHSFMSDTKSATFILTAFLEAEKGSLWLGTELGRIFDAENNKKTVSSGTVENKPEIGNVNPDWNKKDTRVSDIEKIAKACHEANRHWCELHGDHSQKSWEEAEAWQRESAIKGVMFRFDNPEAGKDAQHNAWMDDKIKDGWVFGEVKDAEKKTHPCIVPFGELPVFQQMKDSLFCLVVDTMKS